MSFYSDASLVMIPSGYKNGKVYSAVPTDGSGDMSFTRASNATRVASNGLIEEVRTNVLLQSNTFSTTWINDNTSETSGQTGYDGTNNAWLLDSTAGFIYQNISLNGLYTFSVDAKKGTADGIRLRINAGIDANCYINLNDGSEIIAYTGVYLSVVSVGSGWYRIGLAINDSAIADVRFYPVDLSGTSTTGNIYIQNAQLEVGDIATDYIATTSAAVSVGPVSGLPRLDYLNSSCPRLLLEPQRTNSVISSENIGTSWTYTNTTGTLNQTAAPDGYIGADAIVPNTTSGQHAINSANITASGSFTLSAFVKAGEYTKVAIRESASTGSYASFNLATGTKIEDNVSGASFIQSYGNGWYRIGVTGTFSGTIRLGINVLSNAYTTGNPSSGTTFFVGNGTDKLFCWGMQCELGATYATSYIPTLSTSVTRVADNAYKTGISSLIGQTEGTLFAEFSGIEQEADFPNLTPTISDGTNNNRIMVYHDPGGVNAIFVRVVVGGSSTINTSALSAPVYLSNNKIAIAYKNNDYVVYFNGTQIYTNTSAGAPPACSKVDIFNNALSNNYAKVEGKTNLIFKTRLTNAQLAELTTL